VLSWSCLKANADATFEIVNERRRVTPDIAFRLAKVFNSTPEIRLNMQQAVTSGKHARSTGMSMSIRHQVSGINQQAHPTNDQWLMTNDRGLCPYHLHPRLLVIVLFLLLISLPHQIHLYQLLHLIKGLDLTPLFVC